jgi:predicted acyltransferase
MNQGSAQVNQKQRLLSLDVFRGVTIAFMILVNNPGNDHPFSQLSHSAWNGWTLTDLVFPFFVFIVGTSLVLSSASRVERGESKLTLSLHALRRAVILFALGLFLYGFPYFVLHTWRIPGVLQRIALCYLVAALLYLYTGTRVRWAVIVSLLVGYWILMRFVPVPGLGVPGVDIPLLHPDLNLAAWLDRKLMMGHLYEGVRDPEGVLSTLPAIANALFGVAVGEWIRTMRGDPAGLLRRLFGIGIACVVAGEVWGLAFPINKKLWTSSYVLLTVGLAMIALGACYWLFDVRGKGKTWSKPAVVFGSNAIVAYFFSEIVAILGWVVKVNYNGSRAMIMSVIQDTCFNWIRPLQLASLAFSLTFVAMCYVVVWLLYRQRIFVKV